MAETQRDNEETNATTSVGKTENFVSKHFVRLLVWLAVSGGSLAIFGPWLLYVAGWTSETDKDLRLHILYITGGTIAVLGLVETHRKNTTDKIKAEADIQNYQASQSYQSKTLDEQARQFTENIAKEREKIEADKAKNEQDHIRQVHAERRSRYTTAIEQLSSDKASIRLGGVYTLVGLVDEWLADEKTIPDLEERRKEGQVIINNLCSYIRSPFLLAERTEQLNEPYAKDLQKNFGGDIEKFNEDKQYFAQEKAALEEERQVRQSIIKEIREHLSKNYSESSSWSDFDYDFSHAHFFYPVNFNNSYFGTSIVNFSGATFTQADFIGVTFAWTNFIGVTFAWADFSRATFTQDANFFEATFTQADFFEAKFTGFANFSRAEFTEANFSEAKFTQNANFSAAKFTEANFPEAEFTKGTDFSGAEFTGFAYFSGAEFTQNANFSGAEFTQNANFSGAKFTEANFSWAEFTQNAHFFGAKFTQNANFSEAEFTKDAHFSGAKFTGKTDFDGAEFTKDAHFSEAEFTKDAHFSGAKFIDFADFSGAKFTAGAYFSWAEFTEVHFSGAEFTWNASFTGAKFTEANFSWAEFTQNANFSEAEFTQNANFTRAKFTEANFSWAEFAGHVDFSKATFEEKPIFEYALNSKSYKARFSCKAAPEDYKFKVSSESPYKIETEEQEHNGVKFIIPKDTELFDPDDPSN